MADRAVRRFRSDELETWMSDEQVLTLLASTTACPSPTRTPRSWR